MIPKSSRFKCERCGHLKKRPGKCVWCRKVPNCKIADFDNLMEAAWQSAGSVTSLPGKLQTANTQKLHGQRSPVAINSNFPVPVLAEPCGPVERPQSGEAREAQSWQAAKAEVTSNSRGGEYFMSAWRNVDAQRIWRKQVANCDSVERESGNAKAGHPQKHERHQQCC